MANPTETVSIPERAAAELRDPALRGFLKLKTDKADLDAPIKGAVDP
jgi:hypothetical protein